MRSAIEILMARGGCAVVVVVVIFQFWIIDGAYAMHVHARDGGGGETSYHNYHQMTHLLRRLADQYPNMTELRSIGKSVQGRDLWVLSIAGAHANSHVLLRPEVALVANMHGNEVVGKELLLYMALDLLSKYGHDQNVTHLLDTRRIHLFPSMNPDGLAAARGEGDCEQAHSMGRHNAQNVDLNRNFISRIQDPNLPHNQRLQPETVAVMKWLDTVPLVLAANLHGGALVANYPWDGNREDKTSYTPTPDDDVYRHLASVYSEAHSGMHLGLPCYEDDDESESFLNGITNGAAWYAVDGSFQDYQYAYYGTMALTLEVSCCKYPPASTLHQHWLENRIALLHFLEQGDKGVRGLITDTQGNGLERATLMVQGREIKFRTNANGEFWRYLLPGDYVLQIQGDGYISVSLPFTVPNHDSPKPYVILNVALLAENELMPAETEAPSVQEITMSLEDIDRVLGRGRGEDGNDIVVVDSAGSNAYSLKQADVRGFCVWTVLFVLCLKSCLA